MVENEIKKCLSDTMKKVDEDFLKLAAKKYGRFACWLAVVQFTLVNFAFIFLLMLLVFFIS